MGDPLAGPLALRPHLASPVCTQWEIRAAHLGSSWQLPLHWPSGFRELGVPEEGEQQLAVAQVWGGLTSLHATPPQWTAHPFPFQAESSLHLEPKHIWKSCSLCRQRHVDAPPLYCKSRPPFLAAGFRPLNPTCTRRLVT